ncbi:MAG: PHP domain-containing protein [Clostridia bacterium]|nr:PHP domain-containing protein [Clostridia bacterium]
MGNYYYDLHTHSCLSPCGSNDATPASIAGFGVLNGLNLLALTDHNSCANCPAFFKAARAYGLVPVAGMELTTAEDIHAVCLFETLEGALAFDREVEKRRMPVKNREEIFGEQLIMDENDEIIGRKENLLITAADISLQEAPTLAAGFGGICYPAHIDREANGVIAVLGDFPPEPPFPCAELRDKSNAASYLAAYPILQNKTLVFSSDAHNLADISGKENCLELEGESEREIIQSLFERLRR